MQPIVRAIKHFPFTHILGWSATRYDLFSLCKRRYFFHYYAKYDLEIQVRRLTRFKELVTLPLETGGIVHQVIEALLNRLKSTTQDIDRPRFHAYADNLIAESLEQKPFEEVVYGEVSQIDPSDLAPKIHACLDNLLASRRFAWLVEEAVATAPEWIIDPSGYGETRSAGPEGVLQGRLPLPARRWAAHRRLEDREDRLGQTPQAASRLCHLGRLPF